MDWKSNSMIWGLFKFTLAVCTISNDWYFFSSTKASLVEPTTSKNLLGYPGENQKTSNNTTSDEKSKKLGYNGENPTPGDVTPSKNIKSEVKSKKLGFNGENPTPGDVVLSKNTTSDAKSRLPGDLGENSTTKQINITTSTPDANNAIAEVVNATTDGNTATADADAALVDAMSAEFILLYNATDAFNIKDLSASEMAKVIFFELQEKLSQLNTLT